MLKKIKLAIVEWLLSSVESDHIVQEIQNREVVYVSKRPEPIKAPELNEHFDHLFQWRRRWFVDKKEDQIINYWECDVSNVFRNCRNASMRKYQTRYYIAIDTKSTLLMQVVKVYHNDMNMVVLQALADQLESKARLVDSPSFLEHKFSDLINSLPL